MTLTRGLLIRIYSIPHVIGNGSDRRTTGATMGLQHDFILLDRNVDGDWELLRFINDARSIEERR
jgi:hypothetical protein